MTGAAPHGRPRESAPPAGLRRDAARSAGVAAVSYMAFQVLMFVAYVVLARLTTPAVFGTFAAGSVLVGIGALFSESGMSAALVQRRENVEAAAATALASTFVGGLLLALLALAFSPLVALVFDSSEAGLVAAVMSGHLIVNGLTGVPRALLQKRLALSRWLVDPLAALAFGGTAAAGLAFDFGVWALVAGFYASSFTRAAGYWVAAWWKPDTHLISISMWRELAQFARHIIASELLRETMNIANTTLVGRYLGPTSLGNFRFGWRLVTQATAPAMVANAYTLQPAMVKLADDPVRMRAAALSSFRLVSIVAFPIGALFIPFGNSLAVLLFGEAWRACGPIMVALAGMGIALPLESISSEICKASGRPDILPRMHIIWAGTSVALIAGLVQFGAVAVGVAWSVSTACTALYALTRLSEVIGLNERDLVRAIAPPLLTALGTAIVLLLFNHYVLGTYPQEDLLTWVQLVAELLVGAAIYFGGLALFASDALMELRRTALMLFRRHESDELAPTRLSR
jgi:O-antigen/teichoic acid export membrane protein